MCVDMKKLETPALDYKKPIRLERTWESQDQ